LTPLARPVGSGLYAVEGLQDLLQQVEIMPAQVHGSNFEAPGEKGLVEGASGSFHSFGLADADDFHKLKQLSLQTLSRGWGGPNWHVSSMGRSTPWGN
jgi:hypothetical protein